MLHTLTAHLGAGHADLGAGVDVHAAVGLPGDGAAHGVGDAHRQSPPLLAVAQCHQAVRRLPWGRRGGGREDKSRSLVCATLLLVKI